MSAFVPASLSGFAAGFALSHWLDPVSGRRRRSRASDKLTRFAGAVASDARKGVRDLTNRSLGMLHDAKQCLVVDLADDRVLAERVRAVVGLLVSYPRALEIDARDGCVELRGAVLATEVDGLLEGVGRVRGVRELDPEELQVRETTDLPALQRGRGRPASEGSPRAWPPAKRLLMAASGLGVAALTLSRLSLAGLGLAAVGLAAAAAAREKRDELRAPSADAGIGAASA